MLINNRDRKEKLHRVSRKYLLIQDSVGSNHNTICVLNGVEINSKLIPCEKLCLSMKFIFDQMDIAVSKNVWTKTKQLFPLPIVT